MEARVSARLTPAEGRRFAFTLGGAFLAIAALLAWKAHPSAAYAVGGLAALLGLAGVVAPTVLGPVERAWMGLAHFLSKFTTPIVMGVLFFVIITPAGLLRRALGKGSIARRRDAASFWHVRPSGTGRSDLNRQF